MCSQCDVQLYPPAKVPLFPSGNSCGQCWTLNARCWEPFNRSVFFFRKWVMLTLPTPPCPEQTCTQGLFNEPLSISVESENIKGRSQLEFVRWHALPSYPFSSTALFFCMERNGTWRFHVLRTDNRIKRTFHFTPCRKIRKIGFPLCCLMI